MPEPTRAQNDAIADLKSKFGKANVKGHMANKDTHNVRVEVKCMAGMWQWYYDTDGRYIGGSLQQRLFEPEPPKHIPGNALDN